MRHTLVAAVAVILCLAPVYVAAQALDSGPVLTEAAESSPAPASEADPVGILFQIINDVRTGNWRLVAAGGLALLMLVLTKLRDKVRWFKGDRGGAVLVMLLSLGGALSTALFSSAELDLKLFLGAAGIAWTAVGGYTWLKKLLWPGDAEPAAGE